MEGDISVEVSLLLDHILDCVVKGSVKPTDRERNKRERETPNYFVALRIYNPKILSKIAEVQSRLLDNEKRLKSSLIPISSMHITLFVMHLDEERCLHHAAKAVENVMKEWDKPISLNFMSLNSFRQEVLFADLEEVPESLLQLSALVTRCFEAEGIFSTDSRALTPHLTIAKRSKMDFKDAKKVKKIRAEWYSEFAQEYFGTETVTEIQVCSMEKPKETDGYYYTPIKCRIAN